MNRTRGFVNQNCFKSGRAIKRVTKLTDNRGKKRAGGKNKGADKIPLSYNFGA